MKSPKSKLKKAQKEKARRRDYVRRKNINSNVPKDTTFEKVEKYRSVYSPVIKKAVVTHIGYKEVIKKTPRYAIHIKGDTSKKRVINSSIGNVDRKEGMVAYPISRKFKKLIVKK